MELQRSDARFQTTRWTLVDALDGVDEARRRAALESLSALYWPAVYAYLRRQGKGREDACEITQAFFAEVVLSRALFKHADQSRGRLRTLILSALKNYLVDRHRRDVSRGSEITLSLDGLALAEHEIAQADGAAPEAVYDRQWALVLFREAIRRCEEHFSSTGRRRHWQLFEARVVRPAAGGCESPPLTQVAPQLGFAGAADAAAAVQVVKRRITALLREVAAETATTPADQQAEYDALRSLLR